MYKCQSLLIGLHLFGWFSYYLQNYCIEPQEDALFKSKIVKYIGSLVVQPRSFVG